VGVAIALGQKIGAVAAVKTLAATVSDRAALGPERRAVGGRHDAQVGFEAANKAGFTATALVEQAGTGVSHWPAKARASGERTSGIGGAGVVRVNFGVRNAP
jgi:hypothetical protein